MKINMKKFLVSFVMIASFLFLASTVSAVDFSNVVVTVDDLSASSNDLSVIAGELVTVEVFFTSNDNASNVKVKVEIEGEKVDIDEVTKPFDVESGKRYKKTLILRVPSDLQDEVSDDATLNIKIFGGESETFRVSFALRVQRPSFNVRLMSIETPQVIEVGKLFPVDIVLKNTGYNKLDDLYVTLEISGLNVMKTTFFGDLVAIEEENGHDDDDDTIRRRVFLQVPHGVEEGAYKLNVEVSNNDLVLNKVKEIFIENDFPSNIIVSGDDLLFVNPTDKLMVLKLVPESTGSLSVSLSQDLVVIPAGSSRTVTVTATANDAGTYSYKINVFSVKGDLVDTVTLSKTIDKSANSAVVILTVILGIIFLVLLAVLVVLVTRKPEKTEDLGESYY